MKLKINYQYTYFIYTFSIKEENYKKYVINLIKNPKYNLKFFDAFKDIELYNYFIPSIRKSTFQDFSFSLEKINKFKKINKSEQYDIFFKQNCLFFEYKIDKMIQGKIREKDGIFFNVEKIELVCFKSGICFLLFKTHLEEINDFSDILNFNYKFTNLNFENKNLKKIDKIKIQTDAFSNMKEITEIIDNITGIKNSNFDLDIDDSVFQTYSYACIDSSHWNNEKDFEDIENEFLKYSTVSESSTNVNVDYDKLNIISNARYMKLRINNKGAFLICSSTDVHNYTKLPIQYENQYLYTYLIALHQRYYLKKIGKEFDFKNNRLISKKFIEFTKNIWINEITTEDLGQTIYNRCKQKMNLDGLYQEAKIKYDTSYKEAKVGKNIKQNRIIILLLILTSIIGTANFASWLFLK